MQPISPREDHEPGRPSPGQSGPRRGWRRHPQRRPAKLFLHWPLTLALGAIMLWGALAIYGTVAEAYTSYMSDLPSPTTMTERETFLTTRIFDRNGVLLAEVTDPAGGKRSLAHYDQLPHDLILATIAAEDPSFFVNPGFDVRGIARAVYDNLREGDIVSGASTITQQVARNTMMDDEERTRQTFSRKLKELVLAYMLTRHYTKSQILEIYYNEVYYGNRSYGVEAASESYFGKPARDLTLPEAALLSGLPQAPSAYNPYTNLDAAKVRQRYVLDRMVKSGFITKERAREAEQAELHFVPPPESQSVVAPHWVNYVRDLLEEKYGPEALYTRGLQVTTTLDMNLQDLAQEVARRRIDEFQAEFDAHNAAIVAINPKTGEILTMLGSVDFDDRGIDGQVNVAVSERQPGSSIKPVVYITAFEKGYTPATIAQDVPTTFIGQFGQFWKPVNWDFKFRGPVTIRQALAQSLNLPAVRTLQAVGLPAFIRSAERMGITTFTNRPTLGLAIAIGGGEVKLVELTGAYSVLAAMGERHPNVAILKVVDGEGKVLEEFKPSKGERIFDPRLVYELITVMSDGISRIPSFGIDSPLNLDSRMGAVKTGTTDDFRDVWTVGFTPQLVAGVWVGNADGKPMKTLFSGRTAGWIWHDFMEGALKDQPVEWYDRPEGMQYRDSCQPDGSGQCLDVVRDWFPEGMNPVGPLAAQPRPNHWVRQPGVLKAVVREYPEERPDGVYLVTQWSDGSYELRKADQPAPAAPTDQHLPLSVQANPVLRSQPQTPPVGEPGTFPPQRPRRVTERVYPEWHEDGIYLITQWSDGTYDKQKIQSRETALATPPSQTIREQERRVPVREYPEEHPDGLYLVTEYADGTYDRVKIPTSPASPPAPSASGAPERAVLREYPEQHADGLYYVIQYADGGYDVSRLELLNE